VGGGAARQQTTALPPANLERWLYRFPEIVERSLDEMEPHHLTTYLIELAGAFNQFYAEVQIINPEDSNSKYYLALTQATSTILKNGLWLLGIKVPAKM
jgi:arginyl-tRNA synthetase